MFSRFTLSKGFSLVEVSVTFFIAALISTAVIVVLQGSAKPGADSAAKTALLETAQAQSSFYSKNNRPATLSEMANLDTSASFAESASTGPLTISLGVAGNSVYAAASAEQGSCWLLQLNFEPNPGQDPQIWGVSDSVECSFVFASLLVPTGTDVGSSVNKPQNIVTVS